jgi:hypothetical protein
MKTSKRILFIELSDVNFGNPFRFQEIVAIWALGKYSKNTWHKFSDQIFVHYCCLSVIADCLFYI